MFYKILIRPVLFLYDPERAHNISFYLIKKIFKLKIISNLVYFFYNNSQNTEVELFGLKFKNRIGLAAGFDKNAILFNEFGLFGFGHVEIGTVTPKPQDGNDKPRLYRLKRNEAIINRMGFNNDGANIIKNRLKKGKSNSLIIGGNIGKNKLTPNSKAIEDYVYCFEELYDVVDYFVVNVSSPNTPGLRELQDKEPLMNILSELMKVNRSKLNQKPILLKIAPDLEPSQLDDIIEIIHSTGIQGVIATNTTINRSGLSYSENEIQNFGAGGLSGKPLKKRSTEVVKYLSEKSGKAFPIIAVGGISSPEDAIEKLKAGADLIQLYTGFIYEGPSLVKKINIAISKYLKSEKNDGKNN